MIHQLKLSCFQQHEDRTFNFAPGLVAIKGANEGGKSTIVRGVMYALFGAKALPGTLADTVTWGRKESELKVDLTLDLQGRLFNFKRGKSGAEANYDGGTVTGQNEVSAFAAEILGGDLNVVSRLMVANQNNLRGALEEGPKAVATQIEALADFDLFDRIIEAAQEKWLLGSPATLEDRVKLSQEVLDTLTVAEPDLVPLNLQMDLITSKLIESELQLKELVVQQNCADAAVASAQTVQRMYDGVVTSLRKAKEQRTLHDEQRKAAVTKAEAKPDLAALAALKTDLEGIGLRAARKTAYGAFVKLDYPETFWEGTREGMLDEMDRLQVAIDTKADERTTVMAEVNTVKGQIQTLTSRVIKTLTCPTCKQELANKVEIEAQNIRLEDEIEILNGKLRELLTKAAGFDPVIKDLRDELADYKALQKVAQPFESYAASHGTYVTVDTRAYPPKLIWVGETPTDEAASVADIQFRIANIESQKAECDRNAARAEALVQTLKEDDEQVQRLTGQLLEFGDLPDGDQLRETARLAANATATLRVQIERMKQDYAEVVAQRTELVRAFEAAKARHAEAAQAVVKAKQELTQINFNNALLKKIRGARPLIADKLWELVLTSVSTMFSQMRGEKSVVTKDGEGFKVNGARVTCLSGSTLDILGKSIRMALVKTFIPNCSFMLLDEPFASMDRTRSEDALAFVMASGIQQVILITHEDISESVAASIIEI
jgi:DNA repair exonuclease SbcCD ATPase subunit